MTQALLELRGVTFAYDPGRPVLSALDFELAPGERIGLAGANGSGKSTLLQIIVGLLVPTEGTIRCFNEARSCEADFIEVRRRIGLLFQDSDDQLFCPTVAEDVAFGPLNLGKTRAEADAIVRRTLRMVGLDGFENRITYKLSGGEKRLVALATVLAMEPDVLLLDEPLAGLDQDHSERVESILGERTQAMVVIAHDRAFLGRLTTRTAELRHGKLTWSDPAWPTPLAGSPRPT
ncbi:MAG: putative ABC transporter ATP-binding protein [Candidatus Hydrogenedentota bacterium]